MNSQSRLGICAVSSDAGSASPASAHWRGIGEFMRQVQPATIWIQQPSALLTEVHRPDTVQRPYVIGLPEGN
jgi:hypothetical protein